jgi:hypothetical protein
VLSLDSLLLQRLGYLFREERPLPKALQHQLYLDLIVLPCVNNQNVGGLTGNVMNVLARGKKSESLSRAADSSTVRCENDYNDEVSMFVVRIRRLSGMVALWGGVTLTLLAVAAVSVSTYPAYAPAYYLAVVGLSLIVAGLLEIFS